MKLVQKILARITGRVKVVTIPDIDSFAWPIEYHHNSWNGKLSSLDEFLDRRIKAGYPYKYKGQERGIIKNKTD